MTKKLKALAAVGAVAVAMSVVMTTQAQGATTLVVATDLPLQPRAHGMTHNVQRTHKHTLLHAAKLLSWVPTTQVAQRSSFPC